MNSTSTEQIIEQNQEKVDKALQYVKDKIPTVIDFGIKIVLAVIVLFIGMKIIKHLNKLIKKSFDRTKLDAGVSHFLTALLRYGMYFLLIMVILSSFGVTATSIVALIGSAGLTIGLALQGSLSNFASGVLILILKPFTAGDYIVKSSENLEGTVDNIDLFYTRLHTIDNKSIVIPNSSMTGSSIINLTYQEKRRIDFTVGVSYSADLKKTRRVVKKTVEREQKRCMEDQIEVHVQELADSAVILLIRVWVKTEDYWEVRFRLIEEIKEALDAAHIEIPFHQMEVTMKLPKEDTGKEKNTLL